MLPFLFFRHNKDLVESLSKPSTNSKELNFPTKYSQTSFEQFLTCLWKQNLSYWRNPQYTAVRFFYTVIISLMLGTICWRFGAKRFLPFSVRIFYLSCNFTMELIISTPFSPIYHCLQGDPAGLIKCHGILVCSNPI